MALIDFASWKPKSREFVFAYRYPETNLSTYTQIVVYESQEALFFSKGRLLAKFGPGKHVLNTENIPLLRNFFGIPFGGKNPFTAEIWIVNKLYPANLEWKVGNLPIHDADYQTMIPLHVKGQYGLFISNSEKFLIKMVGTKDVFTENDMLSQAYGEFASKAKSAIVQFMNNQQIGLKAVSAHLESLSQYLKQSLLAFWDEYGLTLTKFYVTEISVDTSLPEGKKIANALASQASMSITGHTWQQEQMFDMANNAVGKMGDSNNSLLAGLMAFNMMGGMGSATGLLQTHNNQPTFNEAPNARKEGYADSQDNKEVYCAHCSRKHLVTQQFCPYCGSEYNPCPRCKADNLKTARRCVSCGTPLQRDAAKVCSSCGAPLIPNATFCPQCGTRQEQQSIGNICKRCGASVPLTSRFCPKCGMKM